MGLAVERSLNRVVVASWTAADILLSHAAIDLKIDPSQQFNIYGLEFGNALIDGDQTIFLASNIFGFLDIQTDPTVGSLVYAGLAPPQLGELVFNWQITSVNDLWKDIQFNNPMIISGDRRLTFIAGRPQFTGAVTGPGSISLIVRGEVTQKASDDKSRLGEWTQR